METVETDNPHAELFVWSGEPGDATLRGIRPLETEADLIAAANHPGEIEVSPFFWIKPLHGEECPSKYCSLCSTNATLVQSTEHSYRQMWAEYLSEYGVEWDPTIKF